MTGDEERSAHLLFAAELARGDVTLEQVLASPEVGAAVRSVPVPSAAVRTYHRVRMRRGTLTYRSASVDPMVRARTAVLGARAAAPPRFLVRVDEFPHYQAWDKPDVYGTPGFERFHATLRDAGVPYLVAVTPRVPRDPLNPTERTSRPHDAGETALLARLAAEPGMAFGVHGLDHRTRDTIPHRHSELCGLGPAELEARLDEADAVMADRGLPTDVFVPPFNRFDATQFPALARRYDVVTGGPETVLLLGLHRTPLWRRGTLYVPAYAPLYGRAREVLPAVEELIALQPGLWLPVTLHWGWEQDDGWRDLERLAVRLAGLARPWAELSDAARTGDAAVRALRGDVGA